jgi:hypothetical protein
LSKLPDDPDLKITTVFSDQETLRALDLITRERPPVIAIERTFAGTSRGVALINRIKADPTLTACEIRIVPNDGGAGRVTERAVDEAAAAVATAVMAPPVALDPQGTRRVPRIPMADGTEILVDGTPTALMDLSLEGAQIISPNNMKPNQRLRLMFSLGNTSVRMSGTVAWASLEMPGGRPHYRAGVEFVRPDTAAIEQFCEAHKRR